MCEVRTAGGRITQCPQAHVPDPDLPVSEKRKSRSATHPETSLTTSRTKAVLLLRWPFMRETLGLETRGVVFYNIPKTHRQRPSSAMFPHRGDGAEILHEVRLRLKRTWPWLMPTARPLRGVGSFAIVPADVSRRRVRGGCRGGRWAWEGWEVFRGRRWEFDGVNLAGWAELWELWVT